MDGSINSKMPSLDDKKTGLKWLEIEIKADAGLEDALSELLTSNNLAGWVVEADSPQLVWVAYLDCGDDWEVRWAALASGVQMLDGTVAVRRSVVDEDWANCWKQFYHVHGIGRSLVICPSWEECTPEAGQHVITIDPSMAFGTGDHGSTAGCLMLLEEYLAEHRAASALDVGTGSGILAIAAAKLGAENLRATDIDPVAVEIARDNVAQNNLSERIAVEQYDGVPPGQYDLIVANIVAAVIIAFAPSLVRALNPGGCLIVSGIIEERRDEVLEVLQEYGLTLQDERLNDEWASLRLTL